jgi:hypothetical protein
MKQTEKINRIISLIGVLNSGFMMNFEDNLFIDELCDMYEMEDEDYYMNIEGNVFMNESKRLNDLLFKVMVFR